MTERLAAFISPHGFGHASRASAVLGEVHRRTGATFELFTTVPPWFFNEAIAGVFRYHEVEVDVGFRQRSALVVDRRATVEALDSFLPFDRDRIDELARIVSESQCGAVLCDIAPLGVAVAEAAGLPSVLVENFEWSWLYEPLLEEMPELERFSSELSSWSSRATMHLQARPVCRRRPELELVDPISREPRLARPDVRKVLGLDADAPFVVLTMGGYGEELPFLDRLQDLTGITFLITGAPRSRVAGNLRLFDNRTPLFMPDLLRAADAVVAKLGYGTVSEVWAEGIPFAHVTRPDSREMASLEAFASEELTGFQVTRDDFLSGQWIERIPDLLETERRPHGRGGAAQVADVLIREVAGLG